MRYIFGILMTASPLLTGTLLILSVVGGLTVIVELWAITHLVDEIAVFTNWSDAYMEVIFHFSPYLAALIGAMLVQQFMYAIQPYLAALLNERTSISLNNQTFIKSMKLRLESFESEIYFDKLERSRRVQQQLVRSLIRVGEIISAIMQFIVILYAISRIGALYAVLLVLCCVPIAHFSIKGSKRFIQVNYEQSQTRRKQGYWRNLATNREAAAELRLFQLGTFVIENWQLYTKRLINELMQARKKMALFELKGQVAFLLLLFVMMGATVFAGLQGTVSLGAVIATLYLLDRLQEVMIRITYSFNDLIKFFFDFQVVPEFLQLDDEEKEGGISAFNLPQNGIRFENVSFTYPGQNRPALDQVSFHVRAGERIALAGENGAGKSTLCLLLLGLYRPTEGRIWIDGIDLSEINIAAWRKRTAAVFQNYMRYQLTAGENIAFGDVEKRTDTEKVEHAAAQSGIHPVIEQWPKRYATLLGKQYEDSRDLSGGQWQKVAISRAYFREADLLILDEPAAALDAHAEHEVYKHFSEMSDGKTVFIVSHRLGSARMADRILFLNQGQLAESGSHDQLMSAGGEYAALFRMQSQWYEEREVREAHAGGEG